MKLLGHDPAREIRLLRREQLGNQQFIAGQSSSPVTPRRPCLVMSLDPPPMSRDFVLHHRPGAIDEDRYLNDSMNVRSRPPVMPWNTDPASDGTRARHARNPQLRSGNLGGNRSTPHLHLEAGNVREMLDTVGDQGHPLRYRV